MKVIIKETEVDTISNALLNKVENEKCRKQKNEQSRKKQRKTEQNHPCSVPWYWYTSGR